MAVLKTISNHKHIQIKMMAALCIVPLPQLQPRKAAVSAIQLHTEANPMNPVKAPTMVDHADSFTYVSLLQACIRKTIWQRENYSMPKSLGEDLQFSHIYTTLSSMSMSDLGAWWTLAEFLSKFLDVIFFHGL